MAKRHARHIVLSVNFHVQDEGVDTYCLYGADTAMEIDPIGMCDQQECIA